MGDLIGYRVGGHDKQDHPEARDALNPCGCFQKNVFFLPKWMVKIMENPIKMDDLGDPPLFLETSNVFQKRLWQLGEVL